MLLCFFVCDLVGVVFLFFVFQLKMSDWINKCFWISWICWYFFFRITQNRNQMEMRKILNSSHGWYRYKCFVFYNFLVVVAVVVSLLSNVCTILIQLCPISKSFNEQQQQMLNKLYNAFYNPKKKKKNANENWIIFDKRKRATTHRLNRMQKSKWK